LRINIAKLCDILATCDVFLSDSDGFSAMTFSNTVWASFRFWLLLQFNQFFLNKLTTLEIVERFGVDVT